MCFSERKSNQVGFCRAKPEPLRVRGLSTLSKNFILEKKRNRGRWRRRENFGFFHAMHLSFSFFLSLVCCVTSEKKTISCVWSESCATLCIDVYMARFMRRFIAFPSSNSSFDHPAVSIERNRGAALSLLLPRIGAGVENEPFEFILMKKKRREKIKEKNPHFFVLCNERTWVYLTFILLQVGGKKIKFRVTRLNSNYYVH